MTCRGQRILEQEAMKIVIELQNWIRSRDKVNLYLNFKQEDRMRLLRLRTWEYVYKIPISEILDIIVEPIRVHSNLRSRRYGLGTSVSSLTGFHAERILSTIVGRRYPAGEQISFWREAERDRQLHVEKMDALEGAHPRDDHGRGSFLDLAVEDGFLETYSHSVVAQRDLLRREGEAKWRTRKSYRNSPWTQ